MTRPVLAIDIGGTKTMTALVSDAEVLEEVTVPTQRSDGPDTWLTNAHAAAGVGMVSMMQSALL